MKLNTNIVLTSNQRSTQPYVLQILPTDSQIGDFILYHNDQNVINNNNLYLYASANKKQLFRDVNDWYDLQLSGDTYTLNEITTRLYFPQYSVDTFTPKTKYILNISIHIHGRDIELGSFLFKRKDALACAPIRFNGMDEYYEYMDFTIIDPHSIYSLENLVSSVELKNIFSSVDLTTGSLLHVSLFTVEQDGDHYFKVDGWTGGQNNIFGYDANDLTTLLSYDVENRLLNIDASFYGSDIMNLSEYVKNTYNIDYMGVVVQYVVLDNENVYYEQSKVIEDVNTNNFSFSIDVNEGSVLDERVKRPSFSFDYNRSYDSFIVPYKEQVGGHDFNFFYTLDDLMNSGNIPQGLHIQASIMVFRLRDGEDAPFITSISNKMYFTQDLISLMEATSDDFPRKINLDELDMNNINLKVTNKITQEVKVITPTDSTKNHILQPVFYQTRDIGAVVIHPAVTENIVINLDSYKAQVERFKVQIEGVVFKEIGRINKGIVFKITGNSLPKEANEGTIFVLNQDNELVTTGKYSYLF